MAILTDRTALATAPASGDLIHVVDVSDTTDDATGTSKKITVDNLTSYGDARTATLTNKTINTASNTITIVEADISDLGSYITDITGDPLSNLSDVTISSIASGELLKWNGSGWINNTLTEAGIQDIPAEGAFVDGDKTKLDGIETGADVTDTANVTSAGALMASNNLSDVDSAATARTNLGVDAAGTDNAPAASTTTAGKIEIATQAEVDTGTSATLAVTPDTLAGSDLSIKYVSATVVDYTTDCATGTGKLYFHIPPGLSGMNLVYAHAEVITAGTTGTMSIDVNKNGTSMFSTVLTIDSAETGSDTAATAYVINTAADDVATNDVISADIDGIHTTAAKGLVLTLGFQLP